MLSKIIKIILRNPNIGVSHYNRLLKRGYSSSDSLIVKKIDKVTCLGLNRYESKNRFNVKLMKDLKCAILDFEKDDSSQAAVVYGERGNFSYGYDLDELTQNPTYFTDIEEQGLLDTFTSKPVIAAISGYAVGFAFDVALWCDFRIVEDTALMGGYARKFGIPITDVALKRLYTSLGYHKTMDIILTGRLLKAKEAFDFGIATRLVACGTGLGQAVNFANSLSNMPQACMKADRALIKSHFGHYPENDYFFKEFILKQRQIAFEEATKRLNVTESEDVRKKVF